MRFKLVDPGSYVARCEVSALSGKRLHSAQLAALDASRILSPDWRAPDTRIPTVWDDR